jgi:acylphosphatase
MAEQRRVHYSGSVQGVGFRMTSWHLAREFRVSGYVRNLPDGRVELVAQGDPSELDRFLEAIRAAFVGFISSEQTASEAPDENLSAGFGIRT